MADLKEIARECNEIASANGFDRPSWGNVVEKLAFVGTELDEARDGALGNTDDPLSEELADIAIRLLSILEALWGDGWGDRVTNRRPKPINTYAPIEVLLWPTLGYVFKAIEARRHVPEVASVDDETLRRSRARVGQWIELALLETWRIADALQVDLFAEIEKKSEKNRNRPYLHGKAYAAG